ncbi:MAG: cytochrome b N-terminal domain-containing protein [Candidatus Hodarchaeales archaeon]
MTSIDSTSPKIQEPVVPSPDSQKDRGIIIKLWDWLDARLQISGLVTQYPVPDYTRRYMYCLGGITLLCFVILGVTGYILALYYHPSTEIVDEVSQKSLAYASVEYIKNEVYWGEFIRSLHRWTASAMIVSVVLHMMRVYFTGSYKPPREFNWIVGVLLLTLTLAFGFTGYLLPWDNDAIQATSIGTGLMGGVPILGPFIKEFIRGGPGVGSETLMRFYVLHIAILPIAATVLMFYHFYLVKRHGIADPL